MPVLLSGGIWVQSTLSRVSIVAGLFGYTSSASAFVAGSQQARHVECVAGVVALDGRLGRDLGAVHPDVGLPDDAVDHELGVLAGPQAGENSVRNHHGTLNSGFVSRPGAGHRGPEALAQVVRVEHAGRPAHGLADRLKRRVVGADAALQQGLGLGAGGAGIVRPDRQPSGGGESGRGYLMAGLRGAGPRGPVRGRRGALDFPALAAQCADPDIGLRMPRPRSLPRPAAAPLPRPGRREPR